MSFNEISRKDPPSPPHPPRPPPPSPTGKRYSERPRAARTDDNGQIPRSPPPAPPPSPTKRANLYELESQENREPSGRSWGLNELTLTLNSVLDTPTTSRPQKPYFYCEDDMSIPGSPPPLEYTPRRNKASKKLKRGARELQDDDFLFGPPISDHRGVKKQKVIIDMEDTIAVLPPYIDQTTNTDFFGALSFSTICDTDILHEQIHRASACA